MIIPIPTDRGEIPPIEDSPYREFEQIMRMRTTVDFRTGCWLYIGPSRSGHGRVTFDYKSHDVHRIAAAVYLGYDLSDKTLQVNHKCHNKNCWNPDHIYIGTQKENVHDSINMGTHDSVTRPPKTYCIRDHELIPENTYIDPKGNRSCKTCRREAFKRYKEMHGNGST